MVPVSTSPLPLLMPLVLLSSALRHRLQMRLKDSLLFSFSSRRRFCRCSVNSTRLYWLWRKRASRDKRERHWPRPCSRSSRREPIQPSHIRVEVSTKVWNTLQTMTFPLLRQRRRSFSIGPWMETISAHLSRLRGFVTFPGVPFRPWAYGYHTLPHTPQRTHPIAQVDCQYAAVLAWVGRVAGYKSFSCRPSTYRSSTE
jgi:hypothetical protein